MKVKMGADDVSVVFQVEGKGGFGKLVSKVRLGGPVVLFHGALAASGTPLKLLPLT